MKRGRLSTLAFGGLLLALAVGFMAFLTLRHDAAQGPGGVGGPFSLVDHEGRRVTEQDYAGRFLLVYFGFTFCPDICPTDLQVVGQAMDMLTSEERQRVQPLFITIDPARDRPAVLAEYVRLFHPAIVGLTGTEAEIAAVAKEYRVYYARAAGPEGQGPEYMMDHSTQTFLMTPDGRLASLFPTGTDPQALVAALRAAMAKSGNSR